MRTPCQVHDSVSWMGTFYTIYSIIKLPIRTVKLYFSRFFIHVADVVALTTADTATRPRLLRSRTVIIKDLRVLSQKIRAAYGAGGARSRPHALLYTLNQATVSCEKPEVRS